MSYKNTSLELKSFNFLEWKHAYNNMFDVWLNKPNTMDAYILLRDQPLAKIFNNMQESQ